MGSVQILLFFLIVPFMSNFATCSPTSQPSSDGLTRLDTLHGEEDSLLGDVAVAPTRDNIVLVREKWYLKNGKESSRPKLFTHYELWLIDLRSIRAKLLVQFDDSDRGIRHPLWSPDGSWIAFETFSVGGHSPTTTFRTWVVDSAGHRLMQVQLPSPYARFGNSLTRWTGDHEIGLKGLTLVHRNPKWEEDTKEFIFDCDSKVLRSTDK